MVFTTTDSSIGSLALWGDGSSLCGVGMGGVGMGMAATPAGWERADDNPVLVGAGRQLAEYFAGERTAFDLPLGAKGTAFQSRVWGELRRIPYGETISYGELARRVGDPKASRAVGAANGRNPIAIIVPCHRVIGANGTMTGFGGGVERKRVLLDLESGSRSSGSQPTFAYRA